MKNSPLPDSSASSPESELHEAIRRRAEEIYIRSGRVPGRDVENWAQAEQEIQREAAGGARRKAVVVRVNGVQYFGEYQPEACDGYRPGEFGKGNFVPVRFAGNKMFVKRPNGKELETTIVKKIG
ncbi:MAG: DUF2934 domain-containing protein [Candidatus Sulfotelmatobacter sp.]